MIPEEKSPCAGNARANKKVINRIQKISNVYAFVNTLTCLSFLLGGHVVRGRAIPLSDNNPANLLKASNKTFLFFLFYTCFTDVFFRGWVLVTPNESATHDTCKLAFGGCK